MECMIQDIIVEARKKKRISQDDLAKKAGVSQATISRIESGDIEVGLQMASKVARELDLELREIIPEQRLDEIFGHHLAEHFFSAFCPNPFCDDNSLSSAEQSLVIWASGDSYPMERYEKVNYCPSCGEDLIKACPNCTLQLEKIGVRFCIACGETITDRPTSKELVRIGEVLDGCCKGNPGPGAVGIVLFDQTASEVARIAQTIGWTTVTRAEYEALILGLDQAAKFTRKHVTCLLDNDVVKINGRYRLRNDELRALYHRVIELE